MLGRIFPKSIDNTLRGRWLGVWLLLPVLLLYIAISLASILNPAGANQTDGIDVSSYSEAALRAGEASTALLGLMLLTLAFVGVLAVIRYRAMVPMIYAFLLFEFIGRRMLLRVYPIERIEEPSGPAIINIVLLALLVAGFLFSLWPRKTPAD